MGILDEARFIERLQFFNGQRLFASDLQGLEAFNREMRWLHNQSLHQPGIGSGFAVYGKKGDREITIKPGYAIDARGQEIVLTETWVETVPPVASEDDGKPVFYDLTVSYPADTDLEESETREGICLPRGVVRLREEPVFCWVRLESDVLGNLHVKDSKLQNDTKDGLMIILARAEVLNCQLNRDLSIAERRSARPARQPYIASGTAMSIEWKGWNVKEQKSMDISSVIKSFSVGTSPLIIPGILTATIDTATAGFVTTPSYSSRIEGSRVKMENTVGIMMDGLINITHAKPDSFTINVVLIASLLQLPSKKTSETNDLIKEYTKAGVPRIKDIIDDWKIVWMGIEG